MREGSHRLQQVLSMANNEVVELRRRSLGLPLPLPYSTHGSITQPETMYHLSGAHQADRFQALVEYLQQQRRIFATCLWGCRWSFALTLVEKSERRRHYCITSQGEEHRTDFLKPTVMVVFLRLSINMLATWWEPIIGSSRAEPQQYHLGLYRETSAVINLRTHIISPNTSTIVAVARQYRTNKGSGDAGMLNG